MVKQDIFKRHSFTLHLSLNYTEILLRSTYLTQSLNNKVLINFLEWFLHSSSIANLPIYIKKRDFTLKLQTCYLHKNTFPAANLSPTLFSILYAFAT